MKVKYILYYDISLQDGYIALRDTCSGPEQYIIYYVM